MNAAEQKLQDMRSAGANDQTSRDAVANAIQELRDTYDQAAEYVRSQLGEQQTPQQGGGAS